jgi:hypothetical protein
MFFLSLHTCIIIMTASEDCGNSVIDRALKALVASSTNSAGRWICQHLTSAMIFMTDDYKSFLKRIAVFSQYLLL